MDAENNNLLTWRKPVLKTSTSSLLRTILSLALFIAVDYLVFKRWGAVFLLVSVIVIHELGHFTAMKIFGYKGINMTFVPFVGAYVSGEATHFSKYKKIIMLLAGPLPGIIIGMILLLLYHQTLNEYYYFAALAFLLLNVFNLIPVSPLDGGQCIETVFCSGNQVIQIIFLYFSLAAVLFFLFAFQTWFLIVVAWVIGMRIMSIRLTYRVREALDKKSIFYDCNYDDLTDEQYKQIRDVLVSESSLLRRRFMPGLPSSSEDDLVSYVKKILLPSYDSDLTRVQKVIFITIYLLAFILPVIEWGYLRGWF